MTEGARPVLDALSRAHIGRALAAKGMSDFGVRQALDEIEAILAPLIGTRLSRYEAALRRIADWDLPPSGEFYPNADGSVSDRPAPYDSFYAFGSLGGQQAIRHIAEALHEAEVGLEFAGADKDIPEGEFVPTPTLALRNVRTTIAKLKGGK